MSKEEAVSAFVVSKKHIDALVGAAMPGKGGSRMGLYWYHEGTGKTAAHSDADAIGQMLWDECVKSVSARYPSDDVERDLPGSYILSPERVGEWTIPYVYPMFAPLPQPVAILKAISCYEYQSCEHEGWDTSEAKTFCQYLREHVICDLPGYEEAVWEIA
jgi:hypothetical protein